TLILVSGSKILQVEDDVDITPSELSVILHSAECPSPYSAEVKTPKPRHFPAISDWTQFAEGIVADTTDAAMITDNLINSMSPERSVHHGKPQCVRVAGNVHDALGHEQARELTA